MAESAGPRWFRRKRLLRALLVLAVLLAAAFYGLWVYPFWGIPFNEQRHTRVPLTPAWALECWLWEDDVNTAEAVEELLAGYAEHDIPVRTVLIDSPWSHRYNDFKVDETRYPNPERFFNRLQTNGHRVVLWMTCMVNSGNKDTRIRDSTDFYNEARDRGFLAGKGHQIRWWKGKGGFVDYTNPDALKWWQGMQKQVLDWGVDGWKLDGTDTLFSGPGFFPYQKLKAGWFSTRAYMDLYNHEEYRHGLSRNPEFITLSRAVDDRYYPLSHPEGFAPFDAAPVTWVGDRTHEWSSQRKDAGAGGADAMRGSDSWKDRGFEGALRDILASSRLGYAVVGCDVGGYHGGPVIPPRLYIRWAQFAAFTGLFLNGGHGERRLWKRSREELEIIRKYSWMHTELVPYLYTLVARAHESGSRVIEPLGQGNYHYLLGENILVAPIYRDELEQTVHLPEGDWRHLFKDGELLAGSRKITRSFALDDFPVYVREGTILPLQVSRDYTGFGSSLSSNRLTWVIWPKDKTSFTVRHPDGSGETTLSVEMGDSFRLLLAGVTKPQMFRIHREIKPVEVLVDGRVVPEGAAWRYDVADKRLWIHPEGTGFREIRIR